LRQPLVVVYKTGAYGNIAAADIVRSPADGYKLIMLSQNYFALSINTQKPPFDANDIVPIANFVEYKVGMIVRGDSPWKTFGDLLEYARKNPGKLRLSFVSRGAGPHLNAMLVFRKAGVKVIEIPYKGTSEEIAALIGGHLMRHL